jgi:23S rRNA pseudouridine2605 synthase
LLARAGIASRREIERMIADGRVAIGGVRVDTPATLLASLHGVTVDGKPVQAPAAARLFRYHKPAGLLTTERDPKGRPTIYDRLPQGLPRLIPVGRLDLATEGLLLLTTDGELKRQLELPATGVERVYRARVFGAVSQGQLEALIQGVTIEGIRYGAIDANLERRTGRNAWIEMRLAEGKNREIRRVLEYLGLRVSRLIRTAYGPFALGDLPAGAVDEIRQHDLVAFRKTLAKSPPGSPGEGASMARHGPGDGQVAKPPAWLGAAGGSSHLPIADRAAGAERPSPKAGGGAGRGFTKPAKAPPPRFARSPSTKHSGSSGGRTGGIDPAKSRGG